VVVHHSQDVGGDAALVALVETLEREIVTRTGGRDEGLVREFGAGPSRGGWRSNGGYGPLLLVSHRHGFRDRAGVKAELFAFI
jgi:hypothetical protein